MTDKNFTDAQAAQQNNRDGAGQYAAKKRTEALDIDLIRSGTPSRDFSYVTFHTPIPEDINSWDDVDRVAFYDAKQAAFDESWGSATPPTPARQIELNWSKNPTHPAEPSPGFPINPEYVTTSTDMAQCPGCTGAGTQTTALGDRTCFLCDGEGEVGRSTASGFIKEVKKAFAPRWNESSEADYEAIRDDRLASRGGGHDN